MCVSRIARCLRTSFIADHGDQASLVPSLASILKDLEGDPSEPPPRKYFKADMNDF
jgi:hypothetical protein